MMVETFLTNFLKIVEKHMIKLEKSLLVDESITLSTCLLDFTYFINNYNLIAIDSSKHQTLNAYQKGIQQISSTGILDHATVLVVIFINEEFKETVLDFSHGAISLL